MRNEFYHKMKLQSVCLSIVAKFRLYLLEFFFLFLFYYSKAKIHCGLINVKRKIVTVRALKALDGSKWLVARFVCCTPGERAANAQLLKKEPETPNSWRKSRKRQLLEKEPQTPIYLEAV
jgi:hypothetical protein